MAFETPYFMKSKTTEVGRSNQSVEDRLQRSITEIQLKQRKSILKIEEQMSKVRQEYRLLRADVDFSTDLDEHGKQIDPEACRSKSTGDLPPIHKGQGKKHGPKSAPTRDKQHRKRTQKKTRGQSKKHVNLKTKSLPSIKANGDATDRTLSPTSTDYNPGKVEQRYLDFIGHNEKFVKSVEIDKETKRLYKKEFSVSMMTVVNRANKALALSNDNTIQSLLIPKRHGDTNGSAGTKSQVIQIPTC